MRPALPNPRLTRLFLFFCLLGLGVILWFVWSRQGVPAGMFRLTPVAFADIGAWPSTDPRTALHAMSRSCSRLAEIPLQDGLGGAGYAGNAAAWRPACESLPRGAVTAATARAYFERWFSPLAVASPRGRQGLFTGYYEPEILAGRSRDRRYAVPIYGIPRDLVTADLGRFRNNLAGRQIVGRLEGSKLVPYPARAEIDSRGLPQAPILLYARDPVSVFFVQIQGSGRAKLEDGSVLRLNYAGKNGRPYTPIGRVLAGSGAIALPNVSLQTIAAWLKDHPGSARSIMEADESYVFFSLSPLGDPALGSPGAEGVPLTPGASLAVDPRDHPLGVPVFIDTTVPAPDSTMPDHAFDRMLVTQDTGGAIAGALRGDIYFGFGPQAAAEAGRMKASGKMYILVPKAVAARLEPYRDFFDDP